LHFFTFPLLHFAHSSADSNRSTAETNTSIYKYTEREATKRLRSCLFTCRLNSRLANYKISTTTRAQWWLWWRGF